MNMKKFLMVVAAGLLSIGAMAQYRPGVIVNAGYLGTNVVTNEKDAGNKLRSSYRAGVSIDLPVVDLDFGLLSIQPGLYYASKGYKDVLSFGKESVDVNHTLGYVEMPILANLSVNLGSSFGVYVNAGPYLAYGVNSNVSYKSTIAEKLLNTISDKLSPYKDAFKKKDGADKSFLNPFDAGIQVGAGVEYRRIQLGVGTQFGLLNMNNIMKDNNKSTNSTFFVTLGYRF